MRGGGACVGFLVLDGMTRPGRPWGSLRISTAETQSSRERERTKQKWWRGAKAGELRRGVAWPSNGIGIVSATQPCYIMDGMGECECCIRQGGLQGRADTEDTPEASPLMPDMLLRLQGFS